MNPVEHLARLLAFEHGHDPDQPEEAGPPWDRRQRPRWQGYSFVAHQLLALPKPQRAALTKFMMMTGVTE